MSKQPSQTRSKYPDRLREYATQLDEMIAFFADFTCGSDEDTVEDLQKAAKTFRSEADDYESF